MSEPIEGAPKSELHDLEQPQQELSAEEAAEVAGGFNPQPDPPGRWSSLSQPVSTSLTAPVSASLLPAV